MEVTWTKRAVESYKEVIDFSLEKFGQSSTADLVQKVDAAVTKISKFPSASPLVTSVKIERGIIRYVTIKGPLQLIYKEEEEKCTILLVWNTNMAPKRLKSIINN